MKFSCAVFLLALEQTSAFVANSRVAARMSKLQVVTEPPEAPPTAVEASREESPEPEKPVVKVENVSAALPKAVAHAVVVEEEKPAGRGALEPGRFSSLQYSITLPFLPRPTHLDGSHAGDFGFDPLGLAEDYDMYYMQECELRHARLAMLAVVGWPLSELVAPDFMLQDGRAPSVLNGFNAISGASVAAMFAAFAIAEYFTALRRTYDTPIGKKHSADMALIWNNGVAGDYNFDPAGLYNMLGDDADGRKALRQLEVTQGRYAMLGITTFAVLEAISGKPIVDNNIFFHPNLALPVLGVAYLVLTTLFEFSDVKKYPIKIQKSKLGKEFDEWLERRQESS